MTGIDNIWLQTQEGTLARFEGDKSYGFNRHVWWIHFIKEYTGYSTAPIETVKEKLSKYFLYKMSDNTNHRGLRKLRDGDTKEFATQVKDYKSTNATSSTGFEYNEEKDILINYGRGLAIVYEKGRWCFNEKDRAYYEKSPNMEDMFSTLATIDHDAGSDQTRRKL